MTILFGNKNDPDMTVILPRSVWQQIQTMIASDREAFPEDSGEYGATTSLITSITNQTGVEPDWTLIP